MPGKLRIKHLETDSLVPYARNARTHSDAQVAQIAASIEEFGWTNPVLVDGQGGIIAGHGRVAFARTMPQGVFRTLSYCCAAPSSPAPPRSPGHHARRRPFVPGAPFLKRSQERVFQPVFRNLSNTRAHSFMAPEISGFSAIRRSSDAEAGLDGGEAHATSGVLMLRARHEALATSSQVMVRASALRASSRCRPMSSCLRYMSH